jgi:PAS domain S-box-containing protein
MHEGQIDVDILRKSAPDILAHSLWPAILLDERREVIACSPAAAALLGYPLDCCPADIIISGGAELAALFDRAATSAVFGQAILRRADGQPLRAELEIQPVAGSDGWLAALIHPLSRAERRARILLIVNDIAPHMLAAKRQEDLCGLVTIALQEIGLAGNVALLDVEGGTLRFAALLRDQEPHDILDTFEKSFLPIDEIVMPAGTAPFAQVLRSRESLLIDDLSVVADLSLPDEQRKRFFMLQHLAGRVQQIITPLQVGDTLRGVFNLCGPGLSADDIPVVEALTNLIAAALAQLELRAKMEAQIGWLELTIENVPDTLLVLDTDLVMRSLNDRPLRAVGYERGDLDGQPFPALAPARHRDQLLQRCAAAQRGETQRFEIELLRRNGATFIGSITIGRLPGSGELLAIITDVTARRRLYHAEKMAALGRLVAGVAHELNNPLAVILGLTQLNLQDEQPQELRDDLLNIEQAALRASSIIQQMATFMRPVDTQPQPIDLERLLHDMGGLLQRRATEAGAELRVTAEPVLPRVVGDAIQLRQVLLNVTANAFQAVTRVPDGEPRQVIIRMWGDGERVRLAISDSGAGIAPEHLPRIFEPFFTTHALGQALGLGLAVAYTIVQQHGGSIWAESNAARGTIFHLTLPAAPPEMPEAF